MSLKTLFAPDFARYEGVRPINVYALRLFYFLMAAFVATDAWRTIITHEGPWDRFQALAFCVWAAYPTLAVLGLLHPLRMLPIMLFTVLYKGLWLLIVAYPLWQAGTLAGSPAEAMTRAFIATPLLILAIPWRYVFQKYVMWPKVLVCLFLGIASSPAAAQSRRPTLSLAPYTLGTYDGGRYEIEVGKIVVPESRGRTGSPTVTVGFYRLRSTATSPGSPIVFLMGGPGIPASLMAPIPPYWALFDRLRAVGDVIVLDQRGLGLSTPLLDCPPPPERVDTTLFTSRARFAGAYRAVVASCTAHWRARGVDPRAYGDDAIADDVNAIRDALGAARINLLAFSYGTKLAMAYARRHPDRLDRVVLQGATDGELMYRSSLRYDTVLVRMAQRAETDSIAGAFSRALVTRVRALIDSSERNPFLVRIRTVSGDSLTIPVGQSGLQSVISGRIADPRIPALVATLETGDATILTYWVQSLYNDLSTGAGSLMARALPCSTPPSATRRSRIDTEGKGSLFGPSADNFVLTEPFCSALGGNAPAPTPRLAAPLARPALFITGENDDRTPPSNAETLAAEFAEPVNLVVSNGGHELLTSPGVRDAVVNFFRGDDVRGVVLRVLPSPFLTIEAARMPPRRPGQ